MAVLLVPIGALTPLFYGSETNWAVALPVLLVGCLCGALAYKVNPHPEI
jgi:hypothetical protein